MSAIKTANFGGMFPILDDRLLPDTAAAFARDTWLYSGSVIGLPVATKLRDCAVTPTGTVFRIPLDYGRADYLYDSIWMEFADPFTTVVRAPVFGDSFDRYYWASPSTRPSYNTRDRIRDGDPAWLLGIPAPAIAPVVEVVDTVTPVPLGIYVPVDTPSTVVITFDEDVSGAAAPAPSAFTATDKTVSSVSIDGRKVTLTLDSAYEYGDTPDIEYTKPLTDPLQDAYGNEVASFSYTLVAHVSPWPNIASVVANTKSAQLSQSRAYLYTWVSAYGEEGPPSPPTVVNGQAGSTWNITLSAAAPDDLGVNRNLSKVRIYRTVTSTAGAATYFFVAEQDIANLTFTDALGDEEVSSNNQLDSTNWTEPPADLKGFVMMPNGYIAAWRENEVWFSEPYRPHAWPSGYVQTVSFPIVGLGVVNQTLVVCTNKSPITMTGNLPEYTTPSEVTSNEACISRGSILSTPEGVYYASQNGLVLVNPGSVQNITREVITKDRWQQLTKLTSLNAARLGTSYYAFGTKRLGVFEPTAFDTDVFAQEDYSGAYLGVLIDPLTVRVGLTILSSDVPMGVVINDPWSGEVLQVKEDAVYWLNQGADVQTSMPYVWRSKIFQTNDLRNLGAMRVFFECPSTTPPNEMGVVRLYADGRLVMTRQLTKSGQLIRPPSGYMANYWQYELEARVKVHSVELASSVKELARV